MVREYVLQITSPDNDNYTYTYRETRVLLFSIQYKFNLKYRTKPLQFNEPNTKPTRRKYNQSRLQLNLTCGKLSFSQLKTDDSPEKSRLPDLMQDSSSCWCQLEISKLNTTQSRLINLHTLKFTLLIQIFFKNYDLKTLYLIENENCFIVGPRPNQIKHSCFKHTIDRVRPW